MMKKIFRLHNIFLLCLILTACESGDVSSDSHPEPQSATSAPLVTETPSETESGDVSTDSFVTAEPAVTDSAPEVTGSEPAVTGSEPAGKEENEVSTQTGDSTAESESKDTSPDSKKDIPDVVWIGDSLTQGSLGDDNHNEDNPQAPWRILGEISGWNVAGVGFFGYKTHDIFWAYGEYNGIKDPDITYVYWVGSNDFYESTDNVDSVIEEIDHFNESIGVTDYLVLGTTNRGDMDPNAYIPINRQLSDTYGDRYLDIMPYVEYGSDGIHLTEKSYAAVAQAVYEKLK